MAGPEEEIWGTCLQMHEGVRLRGPGCYLEVTRKSLVRLGLDPQWTSSFQREAGGIVIISCRRGHVSEVHTCRGVCEHTHMHCGQTHALDFLAPKSSASELERPLGTVVPGDLRVGTLVINDRNPKWWNGKGISQAPETRIYLQVQADHNVIGIWFLRLSFLAWCPLSWHRARKAPAASGSDLPSMQKERASLSLTV